MPDAAVTSYSNAETIAALLDPEIMEQLRASIVGLNLVRVVNFGSESNAVKLRKKGSLTATTASEGTDHVRSNYDQTTPATLTVAEVKVYVEQSDLSRDFSPLKIQEIAEEAAAAIKDKVEQDLCGLFDGFSTHVGTTTIDATPALLRAAAYNLRVNNVPGPYAYILHPTAIDQVQEAIMQSAAPVWGGNVDMSLINGQAPLPNGFVGNFLQIPVFSTTNCEAKNTAADWAGACLNPRRAIALGQDGRGIRTETGRLLKSGVTAIAVNMYYDVKEAEDLAGVYILSAQ